jgi:hypothetical protein
MSFPNENDPILPWEWNLPLELVVWAFVILLVGGIWLWTRSGWNRKSLPDILGRNVEDFAGVTQEGNGPIPLFLLFFYLVVALFMIAYPAITMIFNYDY